MAHDFVSLCTAISVLSQTEPRLCFLGCAALTADSAWQVSMRLKQRFGNSARLVGCCAVILALWWRLRRRSWQQGGLAIASLAPLLALLWQPKPCCQPHRSQRLIQDERRWFNEHVAQTGSEAQYCSEIESQFFETDERAELYRLVAAAYRRGDPIHLLARQAERSVMFLDLDIYGGFCGEPDAERVKGVVDEAGNFLLLRVVVSSLLRLLPTLEHLEVAVFCSCGYRASGKHQHYFIASYHLVFPELHVQRSEMCCPQTSRLAVLGEHVPVRDYLVRAMSQLEGEVQHLQTALQACNQDNTWAEIFDENPLWHNPLPQHVGLRLPFTDKAMACGGKESRPKVPLGRWLLGRDLSGPMQQLPNLTDEEWLQLGDVSRPVQGTTLLDASLLEPMGEECICLVCRNLR